MKPITVEKTENQSVAICTPVHSGEMKVSHHVAIMNLLLSRKFPGAQEYLPSRSGIASARNHCVWWARKNNFRYIFFSDSDTLPQPMHLRRLMDRNVPVIGGLYSHKSKDLKWCLNTKFKGDTDEIEEVITEGPLAGCLPVSTIGTGAMLIDIPKVFPVLEKHFDLHDKNLPLIYREDMESESEEGSAPKKGEMVPAFFQERPVFMPRWGTYRKLTEDWFFCYLCEQAGIPMYADCTFHIPHQGDICFPIEKPQVEGETKVETKV